MNVDDNECSRRPVAANLRATLARAFILLDVAALIAACGGSPAEAPGGSANDGGTDATMADVLPQDAQTTDADAHVEDALNEETSSDAKPPPVVVDISNSQGPTLDIVVGYDANSRVQDAAAALSQKLSMITGHPFPVKQGDGDNGIAIGELKDFPKLPLGSELDSPGPFGRERYVLRSHAKGLYLIGVTGLAAEHAVWDLLGRLGYRHYFPGRHWEVVPHSPKLAIGVDVLEQPAFASRRIFYSWGTWKENTEAFHLWEQHNRMGQGFALNTGHAYGAIIHANQATFDAHPEYLGKNSSGKSTSKFCVNQPGLRTLVTNYALKYFADHPDADSISMEPSDGGGWEGCPGDAPLGSVSNRAVTLANVVAEALDKQPNLSDKRVGMYAYNEHSPPPTITVHPKVIVNVATAFIKGGFTAEQLLAGWQAKGATTGIREYYSIDTWDRGLPGGARAANTTYIGQSISAFFSLGARTLIAESGDCWGPAGLGYWLSSKFMWDTDGTDPSTEIASATDDFLVHAFVDAKEPMTRFYKTINGANHPLMSSDLIGRMYRNLGEARALTTHADVRTRVEDLILYTRYVELYRIYQYAKDEARQAAFEALIRFAYRIHPRMMVHSYGLYRDLVNRDSKVSIPDGAAWNVPEDVNPWKSSAPFTQQELDGFVSNGIANYPLKGFDAVSFSGKLVRATPLHLATPTLPGGYSYMRGTNSFYTWVDSAPHTIHLQLKVGVVYKTLGDVSASLYKVDATSADQPPATAMVDQESVPPDGGPYDITLTAKHPGLHRIVVKDGSGGSKVDWAEGEPMTMLVGEEEFARLSSRYYMYFYVPVGTKTVGGYFSGPGRIRNADGDILFNFDNKPADYFSVPVQPGQDGTLWKLDFSLGRRILLTVPPQMARRPNELLLPEEVVNADTQP